LSKKAKVQIVSCGPGLSEIRKKYGHSSEWISSMISSNSIDIDIVEVYNGCFPTIEDNTSWIIMGSRYSAYDKIDWIQELEIVIKKGFDSGVRMLGICFGHQILCKALGGKVVDNPKGWEIGSSVVNLNLQGLNSPLFESVPSSFSVYESHHDIVVDLPKNFKILASNSYGIQSVSLSEQIYGVQFHPEFSLDVMRAYYNARVEDEEKSKFYIDSSNQGSLIVDNFIRSIV
tara:strand:+ start:2470 stop:3162 length:693 start_codon:yes stop_codon:yes gene_type:complete